MKPKLQFVPSVVAAIIVVTCSYLVSTHATSHNAVIETVDGTQSASVAAKLDPAPNKNSFQDSEVVLASATAMVAANSPTIQIKVAIPTDKAGNFKQTGDRIITNQTTVPISYVISPNDAGTVKLFVDNKEVKSVNAGESIAAEGLAENAKNVAINVVFVPTTGADVKSNMLYVTLDTTGPKLEHAELVDVPSTGLTLLIKFAEGDFQDAKTLKKLQFQVIRQDKDGNFKSQDRFDPQTDPVADGDTVRLFFASMPAGLYRLIVKGSDKQDDTNGSVAVNPPLKDQVGNFAGGGPTSGSDMTWEFAVLADRKFGQHVEFSPYAPPQKQAIPKEGFNPGDYVETRVARLYYYRDAHRVAEIINRNVRSYNQAAVTQAERRAEHARDSADSATDDRRKAEREAVRAAEQARNAEQKLQSAREALSEATGINNALTKDTEELNRLNALPTPLSSKDAERKKELEATIKQNQSVIDQFGGTAAVTSLANNVSTMEQSVASLRQTELVKQEAAQEADAKEARARAQQFRDEVTAAETDPDTYVAGDQHSVDPVTQVSISVIGEGLIQLRGPIKGINKIRTMINEIDSPVGQIKIGIFSVQVNGEKGDKMEKVVGDAEGSIDLSRFLVNQSLNLLRRSIQTEAATIAEACALEGHYQVDRDRRYLYTFFGRDFIDELYAMNSEFLNSENKLLSLHAMDTVSLNRALFILALAKNDVRERIVSRFLESTKTELADAEFDFRRSSELKPHTTEKRFPPWNRTHLPVKNHYEKEQMIFEAVHRNAQQRYHFRNFNGFFDTGFTNPDTMNPMQREFIRLAQIFKARLIAEMELKQRVLERGLIEDRSNNEDDILKEMERAQKLALVSVGDAYVQLASAPEVIRESMEKLSHVLDRIDAQLAEMKELSNILTSAGKKVQKLTGEDAPRLLKNDVRLQEMEKVGRDYASALRAYIDGARNDKNKLWLSTQDEADLSELESRMRKWETQLDRVKAENKPETTFAERTTQLAMLNEFSGPAGYIDEVRQTQWRDIRRQLVELRFQQFSSDAEIASAATIIRSIIETLEGTHFKGSQTADEIRQYIAPLLAATRASDQIKQAEYIVQKTRGNLDHRKLLNHLIDEQEEKFIELVEGVRSHIAVMDDYLKRLSIAMEDDFKVQFYDPAFVRVREAARANEVNLGQVERTTILTNNRAFAKVDPQATMEFDLPKRQIAIKEAFDAAKALVEDTGALVNDPTFLSAFQMMGGSKQPTTVKNVIPGQSQSTDQQTMGLVPQQQESGAPGSALQGLVPEPAIYKLETGTGFQIRPVMQPDGDSVVYDFDYMYTTNIREPVRADEKHVGRIKRHFVHTAVQTANFEMREISRYQVALKVSRTSQGVPLLQNIPILGRAFKPAPSAESSIQQNIILGQTNVYPTLFDLMGLRWAQQVVDLDHTSLLESEHVIRGRQKSIRNYVFGESSDRVDGFLNIREKAPESYRPDFYHPQNIPSPYHPNGYRYPGSAQDPTGNNFETLDIRPPEMQEPPFDQYRRVPVSPEQIAPQIVPESVPMNQVPENIPMNRMEIMPSDRSRPGLLDGRTMNVDKQRWTQTGGASESATNLLRASENANTPPTRVNQPQPR